MTAKELIAVSLDLHNQIVKRFGIDADMARFDVLFQPGRVVLWHDDEPGELDGLIISTFREAA